MKKPKEQTREDAILIFLEERGRPATVHEINRGMPDEFREIISKASRNACERLINKGKLKRWGTAKRNKNIVYGLLDHEEPTSISERVNKKFNPHPTNRWFEHYNS